MAKKKTVAFVIIGLTSGGAERVLTLLANKFIEKFNVVIITLKKTTPFYELHPEIRVEYCTENIEPSTGIIQALKSNFRLFKKIKSYLKQYRVDAAIAFITRANILTTLAGNQLKIPVVISDRNNPWEKDRVLAPIWLKARKWVYPRARFVVLQTKKIADFYRDFVPDGKIKIIPNPLNPNFVMKSVPKKNIILNVGRLDLQKNQKLLIQVFSEINPNDWELHIIGEGPERDNLEKLIVHSRMQDKIMLMGRSETIEEHYQQSKIFAFTSNYEGFPNALLEAMAFGLPCISTDCPTGPSELIDNGVNGFLIPLGSRERLRINLLELMANEELRLNIGEKALLSVSKYHIDQISEQWVPLIE